MICLTAMGLLLTNSVARAEESVDEDAMFAESNETIVPDIAEAVQKQDDSLTVGGRIYLRGNVQVPDADEPASLSSPNLIDLFVDSRPDDRVRAYGQMRVTHDWTTEEGDVDFMGQEVEPTTVALDQLWLKFDVGHRVYVTAGQQRVKWGAGRFWNPTDFLNNQRLNPLTYFDERTGVGLLKVHVPVGSANFYAVGNLEGASTLEQVGGAVRAEVLVAQTEFALSAAARKDTPTRIGADISSGIGWFDVHAEAGLSQGSSLTLYEGKFDLNNLEFPTEVDRSEDWIPQVVAGADVSFKISDEDIMTLGGEYFYNDAGYEGTSLYTWLLFSDAYQPFYVGKHYMSLYGYLPAPGRWNDQTYVASVIRNMSDCSTALRLDWSTTAVTWIRVNAYAQAGLGNEGELNFSLDLPPMPYVEGLEDGLAVPRSLVTLGVGGQVNF